MIPLELLSPAKNLECGMAAIDHGADAVYIGPPRFGARALAGNSLEDIQRLCEYAHPFGAKVYATVNTILYDEELSATRALLDSLDQVGVDAILVQDMAVLRLAEGAAFSLHASTQTDNRTPDKVRWLRGLGFSRAVLARELSVDEIASIHAAVPDMALEVFVHGALCVSYSGLCYASQHCFHRSANRGECAQFCRMPFSLVDADGKVIERERHLLSLKDLNMSDHLQALIQAGATSFKIEGRLKDLAYVKNVTAAYSQRLDAIIRQHPDLYCRASQGHCDYTFTPDLNRTFNRGYTSYFAHGRQPSIASFDTPKAIGAFVGTVKEVRGDSFNVAGVTSFANGDGLCFLNSDRQVEGFRANRVEGNRIFPFKMPAGIRPGMRLYRNSDHDFERLLSAKSAQRKLSVDLSLSAVEGGFELSASVVGSPSSDLEANGLPSSVSVFLPLAHQEAQRSPRENLVRQLSRLGDTRYECRHLEIPADFNYFIPNSQLSALRRALVEELEAFATERTQKEASVNHGKAPAYPQPYFYNISNRLSSAFYGADQPSAYELKGGAGPIMQCRHCLRYSLGYCVKHGGERPQWREPLHLVLGDARRFRLEFDCVNCQMNVYAD